jgi:hypothetical protein
MKFFRLDLLTLLISLFILNSCKNEGTIGLNTITGTIGGTIVDTATVFANTTPDDTVQTSGLTNVPLGYFKDPVMGTTTSSMATDLNLPGGSVSTNVTFTIPSGGTVIDSAILVLHYAPNGFYGDSLTSKYKVNVYQLSNRLYNTQNYYDDANFAYNSQNLLGTRSFYSRTHDSLQVTSIVTGGPDTLIKVGPELRIPIAPSFIYNILYNASNGAQLGSNLVFQNTVKGLYITMDQNQQGAGGISMITAPADSALEVYTRTFNGNTIDTTVVYLNISQTAAQISHVYSPAVAAARSNTTTHTDSLVYLQGLASLRAKISLPYILNLFKSIGNKNVIINRAELVLTVAPGSDIPAYLAPQPRLSLYRFDIAHQRVSVEDASSTDPRYYTDDIFGGFYSNTTRQYHFLVTSYVQDLIDGNTVDYGTYIAPIDESNLTTVDVAATPETAGRAIVVGNVPSTSPLYQYRMKLNVIYTKTTKQ